jgi:hypothetical protein
MRNHWRASTRSTCFVTNPIIRAMGGRAPISVVEIDRH